MSSGQSSYSGGKGRSLLFGNNTFQATLTVCVSLVGAFVLTGFASSAYHRERTALGIMHYNDGRALEKRGQLESALEEYRKALLFAPDKTDYRLSLSTALLEAGRLDEAQTHLEQLLQENPTSGPINLLLARLAVQQHKPKQAVEYYQRGVYEYWPQSQLAQRRQARWELANLLSKTGDRGGFIAELMQLYANLPAGALEEKLRVGFLLLSNGATSEASRIFQDLLRQYPQNAAVRRGEGEVYFNSGQYVSARHELQKALHLNPSDSESEQMLALNNEVIDMDPALPYISSAEQMRRSRNLLSRVLKNLEACNSIPDTLRQRIDAANQLVAANRSDEDAASAMQKEAAQLWDNNSVVCGKGAPDDRALDTVLTRIGHE